MVFYTIFDILKILGQIFGQIFHTKGMEIILRIKVLFLLQ